MPDPVTELTIAPAVSAVAPTDRDGILFIVTGPVRPTGVVEVKTTDGVVHARSPEFGMKNRAPTTSEVVDITSTATGGTFYLYGDDGEVTFASTADISATGTAAEVQAAIRALWGQEVVLATGGPLGTAAVRLTFMDRLREEAVTVGVNDDSATGGNVTVAEITAGGVNTPVAGGPYTFGPVHLPAGATGPMAYNANVLIASGPTGPTGVGSSLLAATGGSDFYVYAYSD